MFNNRFLMAAVVALAALLVGAKSGHAQGYFYGYYYPDEHRFETDQLEGGYNLNTVLPRGNIFSQSSPPAWVKPATTERQASSATIRMYVPDPNAKLWFDGEPTKTTGAIRTFTTPALDPGVVNAYLVKIRYVEDGREITQERKIAVLAGHTAVFHFSKTTVKKAPASK